MKATFTDPVIVANLNKLKQEIQNVPIGTVNWAEVGVYVATWMAGYVTGNDNIPVEQQAEILNAIVNQMRNSKKN